MSQNRLFSPRLLLLGILVTTKANDAFFKAQPGDIKVPLPIVTQIANQAIDTPPLEDTVYKLIFLVLCHMNKFENTS